MAIYPKIASFHEIINTDRSNFIVEDHIFLFFFDIIWLINQNSKSGSKEILEYIDSKKTMIAEIFSIENNQEKGFILSSFSLTLYILNSEKDLENLKKAVDIIYPIVRNKLSLAVASLDFNKLIMQSLIKLSRTHDIFDEIITISKLYTDHLSSTNIFSLSQFFASTSKQITSS